MQLSNRTLLRLFLKGKQRKNFDQAWRNYYGYDDDPNVELEFLAKYSGQGCSIEEGRKHRSMAIANIEKLLEFAEQRNLGIFHFFVIAKRPFEATSLNRGENT